MDLGIQETSESALDQGKNTIIRALEPRASAAGKQDLNNTGEASLEQYLMQKDPMHLGTDAQERYPPSQRHRRLPQQAAWRHPELGG